MAKKIWNPRKKTHWYRNDHTPLADAIMIWLEMLKLWKKLLCRIYKSYSQFERTVFWKLFGCCQVWSTWNLQNFITTFTRQKFWLAETKWLRRTYFLWVAKNFQIEIYDHNLQYAVKAEGEDGKKCKQDMLEFIESLIWIWFGSHVSNCIKQPKEKPNSLLLFLSL